MNEKYNNLTIIGIEPSKNKRKFVKVQCDCGKIKIVKLSHLKSGHTKSCGCLLTKTLLDRNTKHGLVNHPLNGIWSGIKTRCYNNNNEQYHNYGGRGIKVCEEWIDNFSQFYTWCLENGWSSDLDINRIDNNGDYEPNNCNFVTRKINNRNKRNVLIDEKLVRFVKSQDYSKFGSKTQMANLLNINRGVIYAILSNRNWSEV